MQSVVSFIFSYADKPDYDMLIEVLNSVITQMNIDQTDPWDWDDNFANVVEEEEKKGYSPNTTYH